MLTFNSQCHDLIDKICIENIETIPGGYNKTERVISTEREK